MLTDGKIKKLSCVYTLNYKFQINVEARDGRNPEQTDVTQVIFSIETDLSDPAFDLTDYQIVIQETQAVGSAFFSVLASDNDRRVSTLFVEILRFFFHAYQKRISGPGCSKHC